MLKPILLMLAAVAAQAAEAPAAVTQAFSRSYPKATIRTIKKEKLKGQPVYEVESVDGGLKRDLLYSAAGEVIEIEEEIPTAQLPAVVVAGVEQHQPGAKIISAERVVRGAEITFEVIVSLSGKKKEITLTAEGK